MRGKEVLAATKSLTTADVKEGVVSAVRALLKMHGGDASVIDAVMIGTTQFVNAFVQRRDLSPVAAIRIGLPAGDGVPPFSGWPDDALEAIGGRHYLVGGGSFYTGKDYAPLDEDAIAFAAADAAKAGVTAFALSASFSPIRPDLEARAFKIVYSAVPNARIANLPLLTPSGQQITLGTVASVRISDGPPMLRSENGRPVTWIYVDGRDRDMQALVGDISQAIATKVQLPPGVSVSYTGQYEFFIRAKERMKLVIPVTLAIIFALLYLTFRRWDDPQVASVGLTETAARMQGLDVKMSLLPLDAVPRALAARDTRGLIKLIADKATDRLLGGQIMAPEGADSIQTLVLAIRHGMTTAELGATIFPYLTTVEGLKLAAQTFERDVTKLSCCAG